jgi:hypothetical protein
VIAFPGMLVAAAEKAGIKVPPNPEEFDSTEYPHWDVFLKVQIGAPMPSWTAHWDNAQLIGSLSDEEIKTITYQQLLDKGLEVGRPIP